MAAAKFAEVYGDEPREVNILLPFDDIERNFEAFMERHTAGALQCGCGMMTLIFSILLVTIRSFTQRGMEIPGVLSIR